MNGLNFPDNFIWGTATSAYQIEGGWTSGGKGESIWDRYSHTQGRIRDGSNADMSCDHYHLWREDLDMLQRLEIPAYRFSIAWTRIMPRGRGRVEAKGLAYYQRLVDGLLERGITPFVTLYHWDLPQVLQTKGGWTNRDVVDAFVEYTDVVTRALGDRVKHWVTHNEPWCISILGYGRGELAPGIQSERLALAAAHHVLVSHGRAVPVIRQNSPGCEVGIVLNLTPAYAASDSPHDRDAARAFDGSFNRWFLDPICGRGYPEDVKEDYRRLGISDPEHLGLVRERDYADMATACDFIGVNYYTREVCRSTAIPEAQNLPRTVIRASAELDTDMGWEVYPSGLYDILMRLRHEYKFNRIYITENGCSYGDGPDETGRINDVRRIAYLRAHFLEAQRAISHGVPLAGYFVWSMMDNFEWGFGFQQRFGLVWVDYETRQRRPKESAVWFRDVIRGNAMALTEGHLQPAAPAPAETIGA